MINDENVPYTKDYNAFNFVHPSEKINETHLGGPLSIDTKDNNHWGAQVA